MFSQPSHLRHRGRHEKGWKDCESQKPRKSAARLSPKNDRDRCSLIKSQQFACLNKTWTTTTSVGTQMWKGEIAWGLTTRQQSYRQWYNAKRRISLLERSPLIGIQFWVVSPENIYTRLTLNRLNGLYLYITYSNSRWRKKDHKF